MDYETQSFKEFMNALKQWNDYSKQFPLSCGTQMSLDIRDNVIIPDKIRSIFKTQKDIRKFAMENYLFKN